MRGPDLVLKGVCVKLQLEAIGLGLGEKDLDHEGVCVVGVLDLLVDEGGHLARHVVEKGDNLLVVVHFLKREGEVRE